MHEISPQAVAATFADEGPWTESPYLDRKFAPQQHETNIDRLEVVGQLPDDLSGVFVRNGSNPRFAPRGRYHWFDGDGMLHGVCLENGKASYANRFVRTAGFALEEQEGLAVYPGILERPDARLPDGPFKNTGNTDLVFHHGRLLALWWLGGKAHEIRLPQLDTVGAYDFQGQLRRGIASHPKVDPSTGELLFFDYSLRPPHLIYGVAAPDGTLVHQTPVELPGARLLHDMAITANYTILLDLPLFWDPQLLAQGKTRVTFDPQMPARFGVMPRYGGGDSIRWFESPACYIYHTINAWEQPGAGGKKGVITLVACSIDNPLPPSRENPRQMPRLDILQLEPFLTRWTFDLDSGAVTHEQLDDVATEFPKMNPNRLTQPSRYSYNPRIAREPALLFDGLIKYDLQTGGSQTLTYGGRKFGGEAAFAPRDGATAEDEGYLITFVYDEDCDRSELWIVDARRFEQGPVARLAIPQRVPIGYHTCWVSQREMASQAPAVAS